MTGPGWLGGAFAAVMLVTAGYCAARIAAARWWRRPTGYAIDAVHVLMGVAMAGMLVPRLAFGWAAGWAVVFGAGAVWFGGQALASWRGATGHRPAGHVQHLLACLAMVYMLLAASPAAGGRTSRTAGASGAMNMSPGTAHAPTLAFALALALLSFVIYSADRLTALPRPGGPARPMTPAKAAGADTLAASAPPSTAGPRATRPDSGAAAPARTPPGVPATRTRALSPRLAVCCDIAMGVTMGYVLVLMVSS